jgi:hypothetical protein
MHVKLWLYVNNSEDQKTFTKSCGKLNLALNVIYKFDLFFGSKKIFIFKMSILKCQHNVSLQLEKSSSKNCLLHDILGQPL